MSLVAPGLPLTTEQQAAAIRVIWATRLVMLFPMISVGIWFAYIPWKVASLNLTPLDFPVSTRITSSSVNSKSMMPLDVFTLHDVGGMLDTLMAEMFASTELGVFSG